MTRSVVPNTDLPTPVPVLPIEFKLAFAPPLGGVFHLGPSISIRPKLVVVTERGDSLPPGVPVSFVSRQPEVATVDTAGTIVGMAGGAAWIVASVGAIAAPDSIQVIVLCRFDIAEFDPPQRTMRVGGSFIPSILLWTCAGPRKGADSVSWLAQHPGIVDVDSVTGRTPARRPGETRVLAIRYYRTWGTYTLGTIPVTVLPAP